MAWNLNQGSPVSGVLLHEYKAPTLTNHVDLPSLLPFAAIGGQTHLGVRDVYALSHKEDVPFMIANIQGKTIENINGDQYSFDLPTMQENETKLVSVDATDKSKLGYGGQPFKITVSNGRLGGFGSRITPNPLLPYVLEVTNLERKGEFIQYTVIYRGNMRGEKSIPANILQPNSFLYKLNGTRSKEFGQDYDSWEIGGGAKRKFISFLSNFEIQTHYHMTDQACNFAGGRRVEDKNWVMNNLNSVVEYIGIKSPMSPSTKTYTEFLQSKEGNASQDVIGFKYFTMLYDKISMGILEKEIINTMVWEPGGQTGSDGFDKSYIHPGIWHQLDYSGYKRIFSIPNFSKEIILSAIRDFRSGKQELPTYGKEVTYKVRTGRAGIELLNKAFKEEFQAQASGLIMADKLGQYEGTYKSGIDVYTPWFKSVTIAGQFKLIMEWDPSLDPTRGDDIHNPLVNGYRLSSYSMIIEDYDTSSSNIRILRNQFLGGGGMRMEVINGTRSHPLYEMTYNGIPVHQGSNLKTGFGAFFRAVPDTAIVWDPTRLLKLVPRNPLTGQSIL
jgi:hypothetical protein